MTERAPNEGELRRTRLAEIRTDRAYHRTQLANERTFSAWIRTGLALLVAGFAATQLLGETGPPWLLTGAGVVFVCLGAFVFMVSYWSYRKSHKPGVAGLPSWIMGILVGILVLLCSAAVYLIIAA